MTRGAKARDTGDVGVSHDRLDLTIERPAVGGRMIARHQGRVVLVEGAIPGERVRVVVERARRDVLFARTVDVLDASPDRRPVRTPPSCGGRRFAHIAYQRQLDLKAEIVRDALLRIGRIDLTASPSVAASDRSGYRMRARLHVAPGRVGFFDDGSHDVCHVGGTGMLSTRTEWVVERLNTLAGVLTNVGTQTIDVAEDLPGDHCVLHLAVAHATESTLHQLSGDALADHVSGLSVSRVDSGRPVRIVFGIPWVSDPVVAFLSSRGGDTSLRRHATAFFQSNRSLVPRLVAAVAALWDRGPLVDLYAGVGLFAVSLASGDARRVTAVERDPVSSRDLVANAADQTGVEVVCAAVETYLKRCGALHDATVIVDPPRSGLSQEVVTRLIRRRPRRVIYVSCDVSTQARDLRRLTSAGYGLTDVHVFDMFPDTPHIETVVALDVR
ncbi:MAG: TRAM domain-containing protein [Acidobacteriota bacterium]|nr:TRAM domain-containing protein [Acidobacteriota bacterium]